MSPLRYSLVLLTGLLGVVSLNSSAATAASAQPSDPAGWHNPAPASGEGGPMFMPHPGHPMFMPHGPGICHGGEVFCASVQSDNPGETIQKLNSILPAPVSGGHYQVVVSVVKVPDHPGKPAPENDGGPAAGQ